MGIVKLLFCFAVMFNVSAAHTEPVQFTDWFTQNSSTGILLNVDLFISSTCPHCHKADAFFRALQDKMPWLNVHRNAINEDKAVLQLFYQKLNQFHSNDFSVPTIMFCDSRWVGFDSSETTGKGLLRALNYCHHQIEQDGALTQVTRNTLRQWSGSSRGDVKINLTRPTSTLERIMITALLEAFAPCSLFCFFVFLAFLWMYSGRRWLQFFISISFIMALSVAHTVQFVFTAQYQQWLLHLNWFSWLAGGMLLLVVFQYVKTQREAGVPRSVIWVFPALLVSSIVVYAHQQICSFSVGAVFQQWLQAQSLIQSDNYVYQFTYLGFYLLPLVLVSIFYIMFGAHPRRILSVAACSMLVVIGGLLLVYPKGLASVGLAGVVLVGSLCVGWIWVRRQDKLLS